MLNVSKWLSKTINKKAFIGIMSVLFCFSISSKQAFGYDDCTPSNGYGYQNISSLYSSVYIRFGQTVFMALDDLEEIFDDIPSEEINEKNCIGQTALMTLFRYDGFKIRNLEDWTFGDYSSEMILEALLDIDAININAQDHEGNTALHYAVRNYTPEYAELLLEHSDLDPNIQNNEGMTPLHLLFFSYKDRDDIVVWLKVFLDLGLTDWNIIDNYNHSILGLARHHKYFKIYPSVFGDIEEKTDNPLPESNEWRFLKMAMTLEPCRSYFDRKLPWRVCGITPFNELVRNGVNINFSDPRGEGATAIYYLLKRYLLLLITRYDEDERFLVEQMIDLLFSKPDLDVSASADRKYTVLIASIWTERLDWVEQVLSRPNHNLNQLYDERYTSIYYARNNEILTLLCDQPEIDFGIGRSLGSIISQGNIDRIKIIFNSRYFKVNKEILKMIGSARNKDITKAIFDSGKVSQNSSFDLLSNDSPYIFSIIFEGQYYQDKTTFEHVSMLLNHPQSSLLVRNEQGGRATIADFMARYNKKLLPALFQAAEDKGVNIHW